MNALAQQLAERGVNFALALDSGQPGESRAFDDKREMAFSARIVPGVTDMLMTLVL